MSDFQEELIEELRWCAQDYADLAVNLNKRIAILVMYLNDDGFDQNDKQRAIQDAANYRQTWLGTTGVIDTLRNERETWKALITSFEEEES